MYMDIANHTLCVLEGDHSNSVGTSTFLDLSRNRHHLATNSYYTERI